MRKSGPLPPGEGGPKGRVRDLELRKPPNDPQLLDRARQMRHEDTRAEKHAWVLLRDRRMFGLKFRRQVPIENYVVDFYCDDLRLIIELDGGVHGDLEQVRRDEFRNNRLQELGYQVLRIPNGMILLGPDDFEKEIKRLLAKDPSPGPSGHPLPEGEGPPLKSPKP